MVGSPAAPTGVHPVRIGRGKFKVNFSPGRNNGAKTMTYSAVCRSPYGAPRPGVGTHSPITVTRLTPGRRYSRFGASDSRRRPPRGSRCEKVTYGSLGPRARPR